MKKVATMLLFIGVLLMLASVVIAYVSGCSANIIGGADWSTFVFYFGQISWLALTGACLTLGSVVVFILRKK